MKRAPIKVAQWSAAGPVKGLRILRPEIKDPQQWSCRIHFMLPKEGGEKEAAHHSLKMKQPGPLETMRDLAIQSIHELCGESLTVLDARMEFFA